MSLSRNIRSRRDGVVVKITWRRDVILSTVISYYHLKNYAVIEQTPRLEFFPGVINLLISVLVKQWTCKNHLMPGIVSHLHAMLSPEMETSTTSLR